MSKIKNLLGELDKVISGYRDQKIKILIALLADGHVLLESVPGLAKTTLIAALQAAIANSTKTRIQMTPDLKPTDIIGTRIFNLKTGEFEIATGPIVGVNWALIDEINRATPKAQSALLEAMQERKVSLAGKDFDLEDPFLVLATMNPIEQEGTYPLPEAQLDRFCFKLILDYVSREDETKVLENTAVHGRSPQSIVTPAIEVAEIIALRKHIAENITVSRSALEYIVDIVRSSRPKDPAFKKHVAGTLTGKIMVGASPRAEIWIRRTAQVKAYLSGRNYVDPSDIKFVAPDVLRHRIIPTMEASMDGFTTDHAVFEILNNVPVIEPKTK